MDNNLYFALTLSSSDAEQLLKNYTEQYCVPNSLCNLYWLWNYSEASQHQANCSEMSNHSSEKLSKRHRKRRLIDFINFESKIQTLYTEISKVYNSFEPIILSKSKSVSKPQVSHRRSNYIGVFKNGDKWQALISINKQKIYIGTYSNEFDAGRVYDFYSILLNNMKARTNFDYSKNDVITMVENFRANDNQYCL